MKKILIFVVVAMLAFAGLTVTGCKKGEEVKPVHKAEHKKEKKSKKKASSKKSADTQSTKKKGKPPESMM